MLVKELSPPVMSRWQIRKWYWCSRCGPIKKISKGKTGREDVTVQPHEADYDDAGEPHQHPKQVQSFGPRAEMCALQVGNVDDAVRMADNVYDILSHVHVVVGDLQQ